MFQRVKRFFTSIELTTVEVSVEVGHIDEWMMVMVAERERWRRGVTQLRLVTARRHSRSSHRKKKSIPSPPVPAFIFSHPDSAFTTILMEINK